MLWADQVSTFINKLYIEMKSMNQCNLFAWKFAIHESNCSKLEMWLSTFLP